PYGDHYLMGVGVSADESGRATGIKVSLYDFSSPREISKVSEVELPNQYSEALWTHHAFTFNPTRNYVAFPVWSGVAVIGVQDATLTLKGVVQIDEARRGIYIGNYIYALGSGIVVVDDSSLEVAAKTPLEKP
ncbi:MAG: beta-propeller domain-containing protein, partial [Desulfurococcaceae archaeon]